MNDEDKKGLGLIRIDIDIDKAVYNVAFTDVETAKLLMPIEVQNLFSPFHAACIINEIRKRKEVGISKIVKPSATEFRKFQG